jgi:hypothetical protein
VIKPNEYRAYFTLAGEFDPHEISTRIGLTPTDSWKKGSRSPQTDVERKHSRWSLYSRLSDSQPLEGHITDVLAQLAPQAENIRNVRSEIQGWIQLVGFFYTDYPGFGLDEKTIAG